MYTSDHMNINEIRAQRHKLFQEAEAIVNNANAAAKDLSGKGLERFNAIKAELVSLDARIKWHQDNAHFGDSRAVVSPAPTSVAPTARQIGGLQATLRQMYGAGTSEVRAQVNSIANYLTGRPIEAAANLVPSADGGVLIPRAVADALARDYAAFAPVVGVARLFATETGEDVVFPVLSDSESAVAIAAGAATGADATVSGNTPPTALTGPTLHAWKASSKPVFVPRETFTDSSIDIVSEIVGALLARIIRFENLKFTTGNGTTEQQGFLTGATAFAATGSLTLDIALDLAYSVPALYRPNGVYMMSDATAKYLRLLKTGISGDNRQLWADADATRGTPATLHGYPVIVNNDMPSVAANGTFSGSELAFGDFSKFVVRQAENNTPFAYRYQVPAQDGSAVILFRRSDSRLLVPTAISKLTLAS